MPRQRAAPILATETGADPRATFAALDRLMREHLEHLADTPLGESRDVGCPICRSAPSPSTPAAPTMAYEFCRIRRDRRIRTWQPKRNGECNEAPDTFVYASAALPGLFSMGLRLNEGAGTAIAVGRTGEVPVTRPARAPVIRSAWIG